MPRSAAADFARRKIGSGISSVVFMSRRYSHIYGIGSRLSSRLSTFIAQFPVRIFLPELTYRSLRVLRDSVVEKRGDWSALADDFRTLLLAGSGPLSGATIQHNALAGQINGFVQKRKINPAVLRTFEGGS